MYKNRRKRSLVIGGLLAILVCMTIGYAAFSTQLQISGTSSITSNWDVQITNITQGTPTGTGENAVAPSYTATTATMKANLYSPGDAMTYEITIQNKGTIDAVLSKITESDSNNPAILFETSGVNEGDTLLAGETAKMTVKISYNSSVTSQPENLSAEMTVTLEYTQAPEGYLPPTPSGPTIGGQEVELVESGDGLYEDSYEAGRLIYRGQNPDNYITFNGETWRIIAKETDGTYKIIRNDVLANRAFDERNHRSTEKNSYCTYPQYGCGVYAAVSGTFSSPSGSQSGTVTEDSSIKLYLNDDYYVNNINATAKEQMTSHSFNIGVVERLDQSGAEADSIEKNIAGEEMYTWTGNVGLANVSDILKASTNPLCTSATTSYSDTDACNSNYLLDRGTASTLYYWSINAYSSESGGLSNGVWRGFVASSSAYVDPPSAYFSRSNNAPRPVVFLKSSTTLSGSGTSDDPFTIV